jgi:hypothetical protein
MLSSTLIMRPFGSLISTSPLRRFEVGAAACGDWARRGTLGLGAGLARAQSLAPVATLTGANVAAAAGLSETPGIRLSRTCRSH